MDDVLWELIVKNFVLIGLGGYIAPRHLKAIKDTNNTLLAAVDPKDSVGVIDSYFPDADFFTDFQEFDKYIDLLHRKGVKIDFASVCSPNYLHYEHITWALNKDMDVICEKPLVLKPEHFDYLEDMEKKTNRKIYNILQLRFHPSIVELKKKVERELKENPNKIYDIDLTYLTSRGKWYFVSWKGDENKSGGIAAEIGIHFYDMLVWIFGDVVENIVHIKNRYVNAGFLKLKNANVKWFLSISYDYIPDTIKAEGQRTYRSIKVDKKEIEFSNGFSDLHTLLYKDILNGNGFRLDESRKSMEIVSTIRRLKPIGLQGEYHPLCIQAIKQQ